MRTIRIVTASFLLAWIVLFTIAICLAEVSVPVEQRCQNYGPSCVNANIVTQLRVLGYDDLATQWRQTHYGGEDAKSNAANLNAAGIDYRQITNGDYQFLYDAIAGEHPCHVELYAGSCNHSLLLVDINSERVTFVDPNRTKTNWSMTRAAFAEYWSGWAFYIVGVK